MRIRCAAASISRARLLLLQVLQVLQLPSELERTRALGATCGDVAGEDEEEGKEEEEESDKEEIDVEENDEEESDEEENEEEESDEDDKDDEVAWADEGGEGVRGGGSTAKEAAPGARCCKRHGSSLSPAEHEGKAVEVEEQELC
jgi:hypothetical protein